MKLKNEKEIKALAENMIEKIQDLTHAYDESLDFLYEDEDGKKELVDIVASDIYQAQQDLLASASENFNQWIYKYPDKCDLRDFEKPNHNFFVAKEAWVACSLSHTKMMQEKDEEINFIKGVNSRLEEVRQSMLDVIDEKDAEIEALTKEKDAWKTMYSELKNRVVGA